MDKKRQFFFRKNRRGLSEVVTTLIIILLSLVAIGTVWYVVSTLLSSGSQQIGLEQFSIDVNFVKVAVNGNDVTLTVKRATGPGNITGIKFILSDGSNSEDFTEEISLSELQQKTFTETLASLTPANLKTASVAPIFLRNGENVQGDITDTYTFGAGSINPEGGGENPPGAECSPPCLPDQTCNNGVCISSEGCTETRTDAQVCTAEGAVCGIVQDICGDYVDCNAAMGGCGTGEICNNGVCAPESCTETRTDEQICNDEGATCGQVLNICGEFVDCDAALGGCGADEQCISNICQPLTAISGTVNSVWPEGIAIYFDSSDLPTDNIYSGYYAKFLPPSLEVNCILVDDYEIPQPPQTKVRVKLGALQTSVDAGDHVELWPTYASCSA
jgi:hypothetical protein